MIKRAVIMILMFWETIVGIMSWCVVQNYMAEDDIEKWRPGYQPIMHRLEPDIILALFPIAIISAMIWVIGSNVRRLP